MKESPDASNETRRTGRRRAVLVVAALAVSFVLAIVIGDIADKPQLIAYSDDGIRVGSLVAETGRPFKVPCLQILSVSEDGKWVCTGHNYERERRYGFFDVESRTFVADVPTSTSDFHAVLPVTTEPWRPDRMLVMGWRLESRDSNWYHKVLKRLGFKIAQMKGSQVSFFAQNVPGRRQRFLFAKNTYNLPYHGFAADRGIYPNRDLTRILCWGPNWYENVVRDVKKKRPRVLNHFDYVTTKGSTVRPIGWIDDDHVVGYWERRKVDASKPAAPDVHSLPRYGPLNLYLIDVASDGPPQVVPIAPHFKRIRSEGRLAPTEGAIADADPLVFLDGGRRLRLMVTFCDSQHPEESSAERPSIWDFDLETYELVRVMDLSWSRGRWAPVQSPSATSIVDEIATSTTWSERPWPLAVYTVGRPPRRLPFRILWTGSRNGSTIRFLDEHTLIYTDIGYQLWKFDLNTWKSQLLWRPETDTVQAP